MTKEEAFESLRDNIIGARTPGGAPSLLVTSAARGEGATTVALHLGQALAETGHFRVLLVDANLRNPALACVLKLEDGPGLLDIVEGRAEVEAAVTATGVSNLSAITGRRGARSPAELLASPEFGVALQRLSASFDFVIIDSPPVNVFPDARMLAPLVGGVIFVVRCGMTRWEVAGRAKEALEASGARVLGAVMNRRKFSLPGYLYNRLKS